MVLNEENVEYVKELLARVVGMGVDFKLQNRVAERRVRDDDRDRLILDRLPEEGVQLDRVLSDFERDVLPFCTNFSSRKFLGFPDAGNSVGAIAGSVLSDFLQQNLINQSFCAPSATFVEIAVIRWLREAVGYANGLTRDIGDVGGIITPGGTVSNVVGMMLARENKAPGTFEKGVSNPEDFKVVVPKGIGHYSVKSGQMWLGCGNHLIEVETDGFRYDLAELKKALKENAGKVMAVVAYAGDSRTMTVDNLDAIADLVHGVDPGIWLHADACHGFSLGFSESLREKIKGIERFDSVSVDPHKVLLVPYTISALLVRNPEDMKKITSLSDLIMQEPFAFGQVTPLLGSRPWSSLKLWFMMRNFGRKGLDRLITERHKLAIGFREKLERNGEFLILNEVDINSVMFLYVGKEHRSLGEVNGINKAIHDRLMDEGEYFVHQFSIPDVYGAFAKGETLYPLRFMCGNPNVTGDDLDALIAYIQGIGRKVTEYETHA